MTECQAQVKNYWDAEIRVPLLFCILRSPSADTGSPLDLAARAVECFGAPERRFHDIFQSVGQSYIEIELSAIVDAGELLGYLPESESAGAWEDDEVLRLYWPLDRWSPTVLEDIEAALRRMGTDSRAAGLRMSEVADRDWNALWVNSIRPVMIGDRVMIRQSWNPVVPPAGVIELVIDPKRAFGTGYHATTQLLVEWIVEQIRGGERVLDFGTGSGILAMTALRAGAALATGIDNDEAAIECARENSALNRFGPELDLRVGSLEVLEASRFELIVANIDRKTLLSSLRKLRSFLAPGGSLLLSGLQEDDFDDLGKIVEAAAGSVVEKRQRDEWLALHAVFGADETRMHADIPGAA
jgi:ribosomal protein L11 methyltransferase